MTAAPARRPRLLFLYLGRRGALARLTLDIANALPDMPDIAGCVMVARSNELIDRFTGAHVEMVETFGHALGALRLDRVLALRRRLRDMVQRQRIDAVVVLMPHIWTPLLAGAVRRSGARYLVVIHDADAHPGDMTGRTLEWLLSDARAADRVIALSRHVADRLVERKIAGRSRIGLLPLPVFGYAAGPAASTPAERPFGFLFFGRIARYKGLELLVSAAEILKRRGLAFRLGVAGNGDLETVRPRLEALGAEIDNRWIDDAEVGPILARYDALALSYIEASQSGVIAAAFGCGLPVVATPVGGLREQVSHNETGLLAAAVTPEALADAMQRLATDRALYARLRVGVEAACQTLSIQGFVRGLANEAGAVLDAFRSGRVKE